jgi:hypothetical protein
MKKILALTIVFSLFICGTSFAALTGLADDTVTEVAGSSIYGGVDDDDAIGDGKVLLGKMSKGVFFVGALDTTAPNGQSYAIATKHGSGSKAYGSASDSTAISFKDTGDAVLGTLGENTSAAFAAGWTTM